MAIAGLAVVTPTAPAEADPVSGSSEPVVTSVAVPEQQPLEPVRLPELSTATSDTFRLADGS